MNDAAQAPFDLAVKHLAVKHVAVKQTGQLSLFHSGCWWLGEPSVSAVGHQVGLGS